MFRAMFVIVSSGAVFYAFYTLFMTEVWSYDDERIAFYFSVFITMIYGVSVFFLFSP